MIGGGGIGTLDVGGLRIGFGAESGGAKLAESRRGGTKEDEGTGMPAGEGLGAALAAVAGSGGGVGVATGAGDAGATGGGLIGAGEAAAKGGGTTGAGVGAGGVAACGVGGGVESGTGVAITGALASTTGVGGGGSGAVLVGTDGGAIDATRGTGIGAGMGVPGKGCVAGIAGERLWCGMGTKSSVPSIRPLGLTKTLAAGFATMTRAGVGMRPDEVRKSSIGFGSIAAGTTGIGGAEGVGRGTTGATCCVAGFCGKRGVVFVAAGTPVSGGADGRGGGGVSVAGGGAVILVIVGIGLVTAVDHAGGTFEAGTGVTSPEVCIGNVVAAETFGRGVGVIFPVAGFSGRGGRLMRSVSRFGAFGSLPSGLESAIFTHFYSYFGKCSMAKFAIVTHL